MRRRPADKFALSVCLLLAAFLSVAAAGDPAKRHKGNGRVRAKDQPFSLVPPKDWTRRKPKAPLILQYVSNARTGIVANFTVNGSPDSSVELEQLGEFLKRQNAEKLKDWSFVAEGFETIDDKRVYWMSSRFNVAKTDVAVLQYYMPGGGGVTYVISFTTVPERFKEDLEEFRTVARTARWD